MRSQDLRAACLRLSVARAVLFLVFAALAARAAHLSLFEKRGLRRGLAQSLTEVRLPPERGLIVDRTGAELAITVDAPSVYASPSAVTDPNATARALARALGGDAARLAARLEPRRSSFVYLARWVSPERARAVRELGLPGIGVIEEPRRVYPYRQLAAQVLGFTNIDGNGVRGLEEQEDEWLRGTPRIYPVERDAHKRLLATGPVDPLATAGGDVALTLDAAFQADAEAALAESMAQTRARSGLVISLDPRTGEILALAEQPSFDPNRFREIRYADTRSRAFLDALEPGSTFKTFLIAAALEAGAVRPSDVFDCEDGSFRVPGKTIRDAHPHGLLDVGGVLRVSSNICAAKIAYQLGAQPYFERLRSFGFGERTGSGFPHESTGLLRSWRSWRPVDHANIGFGQGVSVTPVQLAAATAAIANGGVWLRPRLVKARRAPGSGWEPTRPEAQRPALRPQTAALVRSMMEAVVGPEGTGSRAALPGIRVAGKTGTAQKLDPATGAYSANRYLAWFVGIAPADDPRLVIVTMLDEPRGIAHTGGAVAAPLFGKVAEAQLARLGVFARPDPDATAGTTIAARRPTPPVSAGPAAVPAASPDESLAAAEASDVEIVRDGERVLLPDFRGLSVAEVRRLTAANELEVEILGRGRAVAQEPDPGTILAGRERRVRVRFDSGEGEG